MFELSNLFDLACYIRKALYLTDNGGLPAQTYVLIIVVSKFIFSTVLISLFSFCMLLVDNKNIYLIQVVRQIDRSVYNFRKRKMYAEPPFSILPQRLRQEIFRHCSKEDLSSLTQCSKWVHKDVFPILFNELGVHWLHLDRNVSTMCKKRHTCMQCVSHLKLYGDVLDVHRRLYLSFGFGFLLRSCNGERLKSLTIKDFLVNCGLQLICNMLPNLQFLKLEKVHGDWDSLARLPPLKSLTIKHCTLGNRHWVMIGAMESLEFLDISNSDHYMCGEENESYFKLVNLRYLDLSATNIDDKVLPVISTTCQKLEYLDISYCTDVTNLGLSCVAHIATLTTLNNTYRRMSEKEAFFLSKLPSLERLDVSHCFPANLSSLSGIGDMQTLTYLNIGVTWRKASDDDFIHIRNLTSLRELHMEYFTKLTNRSLEVVAELVLLEKLDISSCSGFTNDGLKFLTKLLHLRVLRCSGVTGITEDGLQSHDLAKFLVDLNSAQEVVMDV